MQAYGHDFYLHNRDKNIEMIVEMEWSIFDNARGLKYMDNIFIVWCVKFKTNRCRHAEY